MVWTSPGDPASLSLDQWEGHQQRLFLRRQSIRLRRLSGPSILDGRNIVREDKQ